jgi:hypothetical protein
MANKTRSVQIYPARRELEASRLAQALLHLVEHLSPKDKAHFVFEGERIVEGLKASRKTKGTAA